MKARKAVPAKSKVALREPAKPLVEPERRAVPADHPAVEIFKAARQEAASHAEKDASKLAATPADVASNLATSPPERLAASPPPVASHRKDRHARNRVAWNKRIDPEIVRQIKHFCVEHGMTHDEFTELAASHFIQSVASRKTPEAASKLALDDRELMMLFKTSPLIINLYLRYNPQNRWKPADDRSAQMFNETDIRLIELAFIHTQFNAGFKRINSFAYYVPEIESNMAVPLASETLDLMLTQHRRRWEQAGPKGK